MVECVYCGASECASDQVWASRPKAPTLFRPTAHLSHCVDRRAIYLADVDHDPKVEALQPESPVIFFEENAPDSAELDANRSAQE